MITDAFLFHAACITFWASCVQLFCMTKETSLGSALHTILISISFAAVVEQINTNDFWSPGEKPDLDQANSTTASDFLFKSLGGVQDYFGWTE